MKSRDYLLLLPLMAASAQAELTPMDESSMDEMVGQAYIEMESYDNGGTTEYNRITFGQTIKIQTNVDGVVLGEGYEQATNTLTGSTSNVDISLQNFSLGYVDPAGTEKIVPFVLTNPFFEFSKNTANNDITGFRIGFGSAQGKLQTDFTSFSGNIDMQIDSTAASLFTAGGTLSNNRATQIGLGADCSSTCWDLNNVNSFDVGDGSGGATGDFFLSFQKDSGVQWRLADLSYTSNVTEGFFINLPTNNNFTSAEMDAGTQGFSTEFIDRGVGRFVTP